MYQLCLNKKQGMTMQERRHNQRRSDAQARSFPYRRGDGELVESDRRYLPDRRLDSLSVEEISCEDFISELSRLN
jgi:hypothetical protein